MMTESLFHPRDATMNPDLSAWLLGALGLSLVLIALSLLLLRGTPEGRQTYPASARFFLIALRLAIGWHCLVEGMEKLATPGWSSEAYLREAVGPLAPHYRELAGDRLLEKLTVENGEFPASLDREWRAYLSAFARFYDLDPAQLDKAEAILKEREAATLSVLTTKKEAVTKIAPYPPDLNVEMTIKERLDEHQRLVDRVEQIEAKFPTDDPDVVKDWKSAKADLAKWRAGLKRTLDAEMDKLKTAMDDAAKAKIEKNITGLETKLSKAKSDADTDKLKKEIDAEKAKLWTGLPDVLTSEQKALGPMTNSPRLPVKFWRQLEWSDAVVMWGLIGLGGCLILGLLSRLSAFLTALMILSFYLAMPPLPGWPESPRLEGHYLVINKTLIEVIALLALSRIPTGRWAGIDGFLQLFGSSGGKQS